MQIWVDSHVPANETGLSNIESLVNTCNRSEQIFASAIQSSPNHEFRTSVGRIRQLLNEFSFQLRTEMQRIQTANSVAREAPDAFSGASCQSSLYSVLDSYRKALAGPMPARTRDMIRRQHDQLQQLSDELTDFVQALRGLLTTAAD